MRTAGLLAIGVSGALMLAGVVAGTRGQTTTTAPAVRVERIAVQSARADALADAIRTVLGVRADADAFVVASEADGGSLLVSGPPAAVEHLVQLLGGESQSLDVAAGETMQLTPPQPRVVVHVLDGLSSAWMEKTLRETFRDEATLRIAKHEERNAIVLRGDDELVAAAESVIAALEGRGPGHNATPVHVIPLKHADATKVAAVIQAVTEPYVASFSVDPRSNTLLVRCTPEALARVQTLVDQLDVVTEKQRPDASQWRRPRAGN